MQCVQCSAAPEVLVGLQEVGEGNLINNRASRAVDKGGVLLHHVQPVLIEQVVGILTQIAVQTNHLQSQSTVSSLSTGHFARCKVMHLDPLFDI